MFYLFCCGHSMMNLKGEGKWRRTPLRDIHIIMNDGQLISQQGDRNIPVISLPVRTRNLVTLIALTLFVFMM